MTGDQAPGLPVDDDDQDDEQHDPRVFEAVVDQARARVIIGEIDRDSPRVADTEAGEP